MLDGDASSWRLLGRGGAAIVFAYCGEENELVRGVWEDVGGQGEGKRPRASADASTRVFPSSRPSPKRHRVLRVPKLGPTPPPDAATALDAAVWADVPAMASAEGVRGMRGLGAVGRSKNTLPTHPSPPHTPTDPASRDAAFAATVFAPAIGCQYVPAAVPTALPPRLAAALSSTAGTRLATIAALLPDATAPIPGSPPHCPRLTIELKPKCGWPHAGGRRPRALLQRQARRADKKGPLPPDPRDLFSGDVARVQRAVGAHLATNATLFVGGERCASPPPASVFAPLGGRRAVVAALAAILTAEPLLESLLTTQEAPTCCHSHDAAAAAAALARGSSSAAHTAAARCLRAYLTATTARDVTVMVTLVAGVGTDAAAPRLQKSVDGGGVALVPRRRHALTYRLTVVDVAVKSAAKIPAHVAADAALPRSLPRRGG